MIIFDSLWLIIICVNIIVKDTQGVNISIKETIVDQLYTVHRQLNKLCVESNIKTDVLISENDSRVISMKSLPKQFKSLRALASINNIMLETRNTPHGVLVALSANGMKTSSVLRIAESKYGTFYGGLCEALSPENNNLRDDIVSRALTRILKIGYISNAGQVEQQAANEWFNMSEARKVFKNYKEFAAAVRQLYEEPDGNDIEQGYNKLANGWIGTNKAPKLEHRKPFKITVEEWDAMNDNILVKYKKIAASKARFEGRKSMLNASIDEALNGIAVPDGAAQPKQGVEMLQQALSTKTQSGLTLAAALKKAGVSWHVPTGEHVVVFKNKNGDEKWRVEPMTLSDKKTFENTMEALWSVALGKAPNAKELEREAAKQRAKELSDHQKEISGLVDTIVSKHIPQEQEVDDAARQ